MSKILAIKGDKNRGNEVIALLEMLGGDRIKDCPVFDSCIYSINNKGQIIGRCAFDFPYENYLVFTLDEFYKKYPYKVGDNVGNTDICGIRWDGEEILYCTNDSKGYMTCRDLINNNYPKDINMNTCKSSEKEWTKQVAYLTINEGEFADEVELNLDGYEVEIRDGKTYAVKKKPVYPQNYKECCSVLGFNSAYDLNNIATHDVIYDYKLQNFYRLFICLNVYWKIAGEQMGLGKSWEPTSDTVYGIARTCNLICTSNRSGNSQLLEFPTEEIRDVFCENFKDLIESCKTLL